MTGSGKPFHSYDPWDIFTVPYEAHEHKMVNMREKNKTNQKKRTESLMDVNGFSVAGRAISVPLRSGRGAFTSPRGGGAMDSEAFETH